MAGAAQFEHYIIGNINQCVQAALACAFQAVNHPLRGFCVVVYTTNNPPGETAAQVVVFNVYFQRIGNAGSNRRK